MADVPSTFPSDSLCVLSERDVPRDIVIISAGKFAREICSFVGHAIAAGRDWRIKGFLDSRSRQLDGFGRQAPILSSVEDYEPGENDLFLCAIGTPADRRRYSEMILRKGGRFATLIHPTAVLGDNVTLGRGVMIAPHAVLTSDMVLGDSVYIGPHTCCSHDSRIGDWCQISGHCCLGGGVTVEEACFFGMAAVVMPGVHIGKNAFVGVGSVVLRRVRAGTKVFGNPAVTIEEPPC
jgi:sugar O-acyltransferase (sialic acid O-acetyltransferase NeuD family)